LELLKNYFLSLKEKKWTKKLYNMFIL
jgi:hypothetical protein